MLKKNDNYHPLKTILILLDNKFKFEIIYYLLNKKMRFGELKNNLLEINQWWSYSFRWRTTYSYGYKWQISRSE